MATLYPYLAYVFISYVYNNTDIFNIYTYIIFFKNIVN